MKQAVAIYGTFDVDNYGDLLFPVIARWRLPEFDVVPVSPAGTSTGFEDSEPPLSLRQARTRKFVGSLVGGGNIVHARSTRLAAYRSQENTAYAELWIQPTLKAGGSGGRLIINAPSISYTKPNFAERLLLPSFLRCAAYAAFRETASTSVAMNLAPSAKFQTVPDTVMDLSRVWPKESFGAPPGPGTITVHLNERYAKPLDLVVEQLRRILEARPEDIVLVPIGACFGDDRLAREVASQFPGRVRVSEPLSLRGIAREIALSRLYVGSSMHGFITALSYRVPALLVLRPGAHHKFSGLLDMVGAPQRTILTGWDKVPEQLDQAYALSEEGLRRVHTTLDLHWERVRDALTRDAPPSRRLGIGIRLWRVLLGASRLLRTWRRSRKAK